MTYKFLNTFIDDLFAFTIKMPFLHRLATLRDDVIFFVYIYQAWAYKVDYTRVNEYGMGGDEEEEEAKAKAKMVKDAKEGTSPELRKLVEKVDGDGGPGGATSTGKEGGGGRKRKG